MWVKAKEESSPSREAWCARPGHQRNTLFTDSTIFQYFNLQCLWIFFESLIGLITNLPHAASVRRCGDMRRQLTGQDVTVLRETGTRPWLGPTTNQGQLLLYQAWLVTTLGFDWEWITCHQHWLKQKSVYILYPWEWLLSGCRKRSYAITLKMFDHILQLYITKTYTPLLVSYLYIWEILHGCCDHHVIT